MQTTARSASRHRAFFHAEVRFPAIWRGDLRRLDEGQAPVIHWDVMDGHFVPNLTYGAVVIERSRTRTKTLFDRRN